MRHHLPASMMLGVALLLVEPSFARASCAEDLTRIQVALPQAAKDKHSRANALVIEAQRKAKARDAAGCEAATRQALALLGLPILAALQLSTPTTDPPKPVTSPPEGIPAGPSAAQPPPPGRAPATVPGEGATK